MCVCTCEGEKGFQARDGEKEERKKKSNRKKCGELGGEQGNCKEETKALKSLQMKTKKRSNTAVPELLALD